MLPPPDREVPAARPPTEGSRQVQVLLATGCATSAEALVVSLRSRGLQAVVTVADTIAEHAGQLRQDIDVVVCDFDHFPAAEALRLTRARFAELPVIIVCADEHVDEAAQLAGTELVPKSQTARLAAAVLQAVVRRTFQTERPSPETTLRVLQKQHALTLEAIADGVITLGLKGEIVAVNPAAGKMLARTCAELVGRSAHELLHRGMAADDAHVAAECPIYVTLRSGQIRAAKTESFARADGTSFFVEYISAPLRDDSGELLGAVVTFRDISQRIAAEQELRRSEILFRELSDAMPQIVWAASAEGKLDYFNRQAQLYTGRSHEELVDAGWVDLLHPDDLERTELNWRRALEIGSKYEGEYRLKRASDGAYRWHLVRALGVRDANRAIVRWFGTSTDIDDQKKAQETLRRSEENLAIAQRVAQVGSWEMRLDGEPTDPNLHIAWSDETFRIFGLEPGSEWMTQGRFFEFVPAGDHAAIAAAVQQMIAETGRFSIEHRAILRDGRERIVHERARLIRREDGTPEKLIGTVQDITERRQAEDLLRQQADLLNLAHDAIIVREFESENVVFWNSGAERLYGWSAAEAIGRPMPELLRTDPETRAVALAALAESGEFRGELRNVTKAGREVIVSARSTVVRDADGKPRSILSIHTDMTEHKQLEQQFLRAQRLESIGTLASGVAHDLNNILAPILMAAPLLREDLPRETAAKIVDTIEESAERGAQIVKQVLTFARGVEGERVLIDPTHLIKEMAHIAQQTFPKSVRTSAQYAEDVWPVQGDPTQLHQVLLNLSVNARDAMPNGGTLVLSVENFVVDEHYATMMADAKPGPHVMLRATDTGAGMPRSIIDKIFDPFFTTKELGKGTGLGLSTLLGIVKSHGGFVSVHSQLGSGTTFKVFLPAAAGGQPTKPSSSPIQDMKGNGETILVVDDEPSISSVTKLLLENHNYRVLTANDGPEALAVFAQRMDAVDVVITDIMMPFMDGVALIRALRRMSSRVCFIASTGQGDQTRHADLQALGVTASLNKPYDVTKLLSTLQQLLGARNAP